MAVNVKGPTFDEYEGRIVELEGHIDALRAENERLRAVLRGMLDEEMLSFLEYTDESGDQRFSIGVPIGAIRRAAAVLKGDDDDKA